MGQKATVRRDLLSALGKSSVSRTSHSANENITVNANTFVAAKGRPSQTKLWVVCTFLAVLTISYVTDGRDRHLRGTYYWPRNCQQVDC